MTQMKKKITLHLRHFLKIDFDISFNKLNFLFSNDFKQNFQVHHISFSNSMTSFPTRFNSPELRKKKKDLNQ